MLSELWLSLVREPETEEPAPAEPLAVPFSFNPFARTPRPTPDPESGAKSPVPLPLAEAPDAPRETGPATRHGPPEWLSIFFDLAWATQFSNLTENTQLTTLDTVWAYSLFFLMAWWSWVTAVNYECTYYSNDMYHRILLLCQLAIFGSLSAFTKHFDPFVQPYNIETDSADYFQEDVYNRNSMLGVSLLFAFSRLLLVISYSRVLYYFPRDDLEAKRDRPTWLACISGVDPDKVNLIALVSVYLFSAVMFLLAYVVVLVDFSDESRTAKLFLWFIAIAMEVLVYAGVTFPEGRLLVKENIMGDRLGTLTTIILGEGLNSLAGTLVFAASTVGWGVQPTIQAVSATAVLAFSFALYFEGFQKKERASPKIKAHVIFHFPLHLFLILLLEGIKNLLLITSLQGAWDMFVLSLQPAPGETLADTLLAAFRLVGIDFTKSVQGPIDLASDAQLINATDKLVGPALYTLLQQYDLADSDAARALVNFTGNATEIGIDTFINGELGVGPWIPLAAGGLLAALGWIALVDSWMPAHRYVWGTILSRMAAGLGLAMLWFLRYSSSAWDLLLGHYAIVPVVASVYMLLFIVEQFLAQFALHRRRRQRRLQRHED